VTSVIEKKKNEMKTLRTQRLAGKMEVSKSLKLNSSSKSSSSLSLDLSERLKLASKEAKLECELDSDDCRKRPTKMNNGDNTASRVIII
jgi:hypothetical protein